MRGRCLVGLLTAGALLLGVDAGADGDRRVVRMLAERFSFTPSEIRVARGTALELRIRSDDTMHGFRIVGRNVNLLVPKRRQGEAGGRFRGGRGRALRVRVLATIAVPGTTSCEGPSSSRMPRRHDDAAVGVGA